MVITAVIKLKAVQGDRVMEGEELPFYIGWSL